jgi:hypothetical protein
MHAVEMLPRVPYSEPDSIPLCQVDEDDSEGIDGADITLEPFGIDEPDDTEDEDQFPPNSTKGFSGFAKELMYQSTTAPPRHQDKTGKQKRSEADESGEQIQVVPKGKGTRPSASATSNSFNPLLHRRVSLKFNPNPPPEEDSTTRPHARDNKSASTVAGTNEKSRKRPLPKAKKQTNVQADKVQLDDGDEIQEVSPFDVPPPDGGRNLRSSVITAPTQQSGQSSKNQKVKGELLRF